MIVKKKYSMKSLIQKILNFPNNFNGFEGRSKQDVLLFDSSFAAQDIAFIIGGHWDGCNGVLVTKNDEIAVNTAAELLGARWCYNGAKIALTSRLSADDLRRRYAAGERHFINANLRCARLGECLLSEVNLSWAKLSLANLSGANLSKANLSDADLIEANLTEANLRTANLARTNLAKANLRLADLRGANLSKAFLSEANLSEADLRGANLELADLRGADLSGTNLSGANLSGAKLIEADLATATLSND